MNNIMEFSWSYSALSAYQTCPYSFKKIYLERVKTIPNYFSEYGISIHRVLEKYFNGEIELWDMSSEYEEIKRKTIHCFPPPFPIGLSTKYDNSAKSFFLNFSTDRGAYEIIQTEKKISKEFLHTKFSIRPDMVLKDKESGEILLVDYKTATPTGKLNENNKKVIEYKKQFLLYVYYLWLEGIRVDKIQIWFIRSGESGEVIEIPVRPEEVAEACLWAEDTAKKAIADTEWIANNTKANKYFCDFICGIRHICEFKNQVKETEVDIEY